MGASQYKKLRNENKTNPLDPRERARQEELKEQRKTRRTYILIGCLLAVMILLVVFVNSSLFTNGLAALKVGSTRYTVAQVRYAYQNSYNEFYNNYGNYISYFMDTSQPLDEQPCAFDESITWKDYFLEQGNSYLRETTLLYDSAVAAGYSLTEEEQASIDSTLENIASYAELYGYTKNGYISTVYGQGNTEKTLRHRIEVAQLAYRYASDLQASYEFTEEELDDYYAENADSYNTVTYLRAYISGTADAPLGVDEETGMANAQAQADEILAACDGSVESFQAAVLESISTDPTETTSYWTNTGDAYDWLTDPARQEGDVTSVEADSGYYVYCFESVETNDYPMVSVRHILINVTDEDGDGEFSEEEKAAALEKLEGIQAEWDGTEEGFAALADEYSDDPGSNTNGGLYENVYKGQMVDEFNEFCFGDRSEGDTTIVFVESTNYTGYHLIYFVGYDQLYSRLLAENDLRSQAFYDWESERLEEYPLTKTFMYRYV